MEKMYLEKILKLYLGMSPPLSCRRFELFKGTVKKYLGKRNEMRKVTTNSKQNLKSMPKSYGSKPHCCANKGDRGM